MVGGAAWKRVRSEGSVREVGMVGIGGLAVWRFSCRMTLVRWKRRRRRRKSCRLEEGRDARLLVGSYRRVNVTVPV